MTAKGLLSMVEQKSDLADGRSDCDPNRTLQWLSGQLAALSAENFMHEISDVSGTELFQEIGAMEIDGTRADA